MLLVFKGILVGLILMLFIGPSFFYLLRLGIMRGFMPAALFAIGILVSDLLFIVLIIKGLSSFLESTLIQQVFSFVMGFLILFLGIYMLFKKASLKISGSEISPVSGSAILYVTKGFVINALNPFTFMVWVAVIASVEIKWQISEADYPLFLVGLLGTVFCMDALKAYGANFLGKVINEKSLKRINIVLGIIFILLSFRLLYNGFLLIKGFESSDVVSGFL